MSNYPGGTSAGDPNAPWNDDPAPECSECENIIHEPDDHADWCQSGHLEPYEIEEEREAAAQEARYDRLKEEGKL